jgi:arylsulfatase
LAISDPLEREIKPSTQTLKRKHSVTYMDFCELLISPIFRKDESGGTMKQYEPFEGKIGRTLSESTPWWPTPKHPGTDAPNVVVFLIDDLGFSHFNCFGSDLVTPNINKLAEGGLRYTNFHVTPLCSPTRSALLTGRNHHTVGMRGISNWSSGFPSMRGEVSKHAGTMAEVMREAGYTTLGIGKWHLTSMENASSAGPFDQWPLARGFDRYFGFLEGETDQFSPDLVYDNHRVEPSKTPEEGYHLSEDLVDHATEFVHDTKSIRPDRPFFLYFAFGAQHAPHQAPASYMAKHRGKYDEGWDVARERWFARQLEMGIIPPDTQLAPRNPGVDAWDTLPENQKKLASRLQEAYAAFLEHTDAQIGRLVDDLEAIGQLDNTLILLMSDNGASQEGGAFGILHEMKYFNGLIETPDEAVERLDDIGGPHSHSNYPWGWAQAGNTPFKWYKQNTHEGGVHVPLIAHWPSGIKDKGGIRNQWHYVTDIAPTVFEATGVTNPSIINGYEQMPVTGASIAYTFDNPTAPSQKTKQYFEMGGHRAMYHEGWKAVTRHDPWSVFQPGANPDAFENDVWELYNIAIDASETNNLAEQMPEKLNELIAMWWEEAEEYGVLPLDDRGIELFGTRYRDNSAHPVSKHYTYLPPLNPIPAQAGAGLGGRSWDMEAKVIRSAGENGVILATGTENSGISVFIKDDHLYFDYNCFNDHYVVKSSKKVPEGESVVGINFRRGKNDADATVVINNEEVGSVHLPILMRIISSIGMSLGADVGSPVSLEYKAPFKFEGTLRRVDIQLITQSDNKEQEAAAREGMARQ